MSQDDVLHRFDAQQAADAHGDMPARAVHCCLMMDYAMKEEYLHPTITFSFDAAQPLKVLPPQIAGAKLTERGRKTKPGLLVNYCPWCGKKLMEDTP